MLDNEPDFLRSRSVDFYSKDSCSSDVDAAVGDMEVEIREDWIENPVKTKILFIIFYALIMMGVAASIWRLLN